MFAGIIERVCRIVAVHRGRAAVRLEIELDDLLNGLRLGASVAVNGACLTLADRRGVSGGFDVVPETWKLTNLAALKTGDEVNVERSLSVGDHIDGHFVQGHVDGLGRVDRIQNDDGAYKIWIRITNDLKPYVVRKGSIAIDGVSLTIADVEPDLFSVALIPTTLKETVLGVRRPGDSVNLETDILARLVVARLETLMQHSRQTPAGLSLKRLQENGFLP